MRSVYQARHELITTTIADRFAGHFELIPSTAGIHVAAWACEASVEQVADATRQAGDRGVAVASLARFGVARPCAPGVLVGYGAIATHRIVEGLDRLLACYET